MSVPGTGLYIVYDPKGVQITRFPIGLIEGGSEWNYFIERGYKIVRTGTVPVPPPDPIAKVDGELIYPGDIRVSDTRVPYAVDRSTGRKYYTKEEAEAAGYISKPEVTGADPYAGGIDPVSGQGLPFVRINGQKVHVTDISKGRNAKVVYINEVLEISDSIG